VVINVGSKTKQIEKSLASHQNHAPVEKEEDAK